MCITLDHDFHRILADTSARGPSTIFIRGQKLNHVDAADLIERLIFRLGSQLDMGIAVTATSRGVRLRTLPLK